MRRSSVLVAVDGSPECDSAVRWATTESAARHTDLTLVHVVDARTYGLWTATATIRSGLRQLAKPIVDDAARVAADTDPSVSVHKRVILGSPGPVLLRLAPRFDLVVVGRRGRGAISRFVLGSVTSRLVTSGVVPVATLDAGHRATRRTDADVERIVLAVGENPAPATIDFAFQAAARRGVELVLLHCWQVQIVPPPGLSYAQAQPAALALYATEFADKLLAYERGKYPDLPVRTMVAEGEPSACIHRICQPHDLLVLGWHPRGLRAARMLGSTITHALHDHPGPVVVVPAAARQTRQPAVT